MRILVPSAGAASSVSVIRAAKQRAHWVAATDLNENAAGMFLADDCFVSGMCYEASYFDEIVEGCRLCEVDWIIPINDAELPIYVRHYDQFVGAGIRPLMNPGECVMNGHCKKRSWMVCEDAGILQPARYFQNAPVWQEISEQLPPPGCYPLIAKPCIGVGGRGQVICRSPLDIANLVASENPIKLGNFIWQEYVEGEEYSVDCWGDPHTDLFVAVPRTRGKVVNGQAIGGVTQDAPDVVAFVRKICQAFGSTNVCCVQVMRDREGKLYFIEFNPRYGTGVSLSFEAGIDFLNLQFRQACGHEITRDMLTFEAGVGMARFWKECFYRKDVKLCPPQGITLHDGRTRD